MNEAFNSIIPLQSIEELRIHFLSKKQKKLNVFNLAVVPNHAPIATVVDIGILRTHNDLWLTMALKSGFARIGNNSITVLVNEVHKKLSKL